MAEPWTGETVDLVAEATRRHVDLINTPPVDGKEAALGPACAELHCTCEGYVALLPTKGDWEPFIADFRRHRAEAVLAALHEAGLLVPAANGETATCGCPVEYHVMRLERHTRECSDKEAAQSLAAHLAEHYSEVDHV